MADASEDIIRPASHPTDSLDDNLSDSDPDESTPDYRFLSTLTSSSSTLPRRGIKDFEPHPTNLQATQLDVSRQAMHDALSHTRVHAPKSHVIGVYNARTGLTRIRRPRGPVFKTVGRTEKGGQGSVLLLPEEALWALETARLDVRWGEEEDDEQEGKQEVETDKENKVGQVEDEENVEQHEEEGQDDDAELDLIPMSLQGAYAAFLGEESERNGFLTLERYLVYAGLKRSGFTVLRAEGWDGTPLPDKPAQEEKHVTVETQPRAQSSILSWLYNLVSSDQQTPHPSSEEGPLVKPGLYRTYDEIFRLLHIVSCWQPRLPPLPSTSALAPRPKPPTSSLASSATSQPPPPTTTTTTTTPFTTHFNVYRPGPHFRKTAPGPPDFRISVIDARTTSLPTSAELNLLISEQPIPSPSLSGIAKPHKPANSSTSTSTTSGKRTSPPPQRSASQEERPQYTYDPSPSSMPLSYFSHLIPSLPNHPSTSTSTSKPTKFPPHDSIPAFYRRLKTGLHTPARSIILAIVDEGVISYMRFTEGVFGSERVWERVVAAAERGSGGGKGGGGGGRGRGGRGRGGRGRGGGGR